MIKVYLYSRRGVGNINWDVANDEDLRSSSLRGE